MTWIALRHSLHQFMHFPGNRIYNLAIIFFIFGRTVSLKTGESSGVSNLRVWGLFRTWQNCWWILQFLCMHKDLTVMSALFKMAPKHARWKVSDLRIALKTSQTFDSSVSAIRYESRPFWRVYLPRFLFISPFDMWSCDMQRYLKRPWDGIWSHLLNGCW